MKNQKVAVLMATYNGERYLEEQIDSILNQTYKDIDLYIRDDNSIDNTNDIINKYAMKYSEIITIVNDERIAKGATSNFLFLLEHVYNMNKYDIFMFSDQDDVWLEDKVEKTIEAYDKIQNKQQPILIHTDLNVVDANLNTIDKSFMKYSNLKYNYNKFNNYLVQNNVTGCTILINKELARLIKYDIKNILMHDWYFALLASAFGQVIFINTPTIKYRQHGNNTVGAKKGNNNLKSLLKKLKNNKIKSGQIKLLAQAKEFEKTYNEKLNSKNQRILKEFIDIPNMNRINKIRVIIRNKLYRQTFFQIIGEMMFF